MQNSAISKILKVLSWLLMGISVILTVLFYTGNITEEPFIFWAYILFGLAIIVALGFPLFFFFKEPKKALKTLAGVGVMGSVFLIGYLFADSTPIYSATQNPDLFNPKVLILTDTGLIATYIMFGAALIMLLYSGARNIFQKK